MKRFALFAILLFAISFAQAQEEDHAYFLEGENPSADSLWANETMVVSGRLDGWITATERFTGETIWEYYPSGLTGALILDLEYVEGSLLAAVSDPTNTGTEGVVSLDLDGNEEWRYFGDFIEEVYRIAYDDVAPQNAERLFVGMKAGHLAAINLTTHQMEIRNGQPMLFSPQLEDFSIGKCNVIESASGIFALEVHNDTLWAARNFGGEDKQGQCQQPLLTSEYNTLYRLKASGFTTPNAAYSEDRKMVAYDPIDDNRSAYPSVWDIWIDPFRTTDTYEHAYLVGALAGASGFMEFQNQTRDCPTTCYSTNFTGNTAADEDAGLGPGWRLGPGSIGAVVTGNEDIVIMGTWQNDTSDFNNPALTDSGHLVLLQKEFANWGLGNENWVHTDPRGSLTPSRALMSGDVIGLAIVGDERSVIVGHGATQTPLPSIGTINHAYGASVVEVPFARDQPVVLQMLPHGHEIIADAFPVAFRTDMPANDPNATIPTELQIRGGELDDWTPFPGLTLGSVQIDTYRISNNVDFGDLPDATDYEVRLVAQGGNYSFIDRIHGQFTVDRTAPVMGAFAPAHDTILQTCQPVITLEGFEETTAIDTFASGVYIDGRAYPYIDFQFDENGNVTGAVLDMTQLNPNQGDPQQPLTGEPVGCLAEGRHVIRAEFVDLAGNFGFLEWALYVDTTLREPFLNPSTQTWLRSANKPLSAQFFEEIEVIESSLSVPGYAQKLPKSSTNPDGSRLLAQMDAAIDGIVAWNIHVRDEVGNEFQQTYEFKVDKTAPVWSNPTPGTGSITGDVRPVIDVDVTELGSGIKVNSLRMFLDGQEVNFGLVRSTDGLKFTSALDLSEGTHTVYVEGMDVAGNKGSFTWDFQVDANVPSASFDVLLPIGQDAVSLGDRVDLVVEASDYSGIDSVTVDVRGLDTAGAATVDLVKAGTQYVGSFVVSAEQSRAVQLTATVTDVTGKSASLTRQVVLDNLPPSTFMSSLPLSAGDRIQVVWQDVLITGMGTPTRTYELQIKRGAGEWTTLAQQFVGTSWTYVHRELDEQLVQFRVRATDGAGNLEGAFSNVVETVMHGDPFGEPVIPTTIKESQNITVQVPVIPEHLQDDTAVSVEITKNGRLVGVYELTRSGERFLIEIPKLSPGTYEYTFMRSQDGFDLEGEPRTFVVESESLETTEDSQEAPGAHILLVLIGLALLVRKRAPRSPDE